MANQEVILQVIADILGAQKKIAELESAVTESVKRIDALLSDQKFDSMFGEDARPALEELKKGLLEVGKASKTVADQSEKEWKEAATAVKDYGKSAQEAAKKTETSIKTAAAQIKVLQNNLTVAVERYRQIAKEPGFDRQAIKAREAEAAVRRAAAALRDASAAGQDIKKVNSALELVGVGVKDLRENLTKMELAFKQLQKQKGFDRQSKEAREAAQGIREAAVALSRFSKQSSDIRRVNQALDLVSKDVKELRNDFDLAVLAYQKLSRQKGIDPAKLAKARQEVERTAKGLLDLSNKASDIKKVDKAFVNLQQRTKTVGTAIAGLNRALAAFGVTAGAIGFVRLIKGAVNAQIAIDRINQSLIAATGSAEKAGDAYDFVRNTVLELGLDLRSSAQSFSQLAAAAKGTVLEGEPLEHIFRAVAVSGRVLNLSVDQVKGTIVALRQTIGKARVSAEELRRQLGDRIPGAFELAARAMGVSTRELDKMMERGELLAVDLLPRLADEMLKTFGPGLEAALGSIAAKLGRVQTALFETQVAFAKGFTAELGESIEEFEKNLRAFEDTANLIGRSFGFVADAVAKFLSFLPLIRAAFADVSGLSIQLFSKLTQAITKSLSFLADKIAAFSRGLADFYERIPGIGDAVAENIRKSSEGFEEFFRGLAKGAEFLDELGEGYRDVAKEQRALYEQQKGQAETLTQETETNAKIALENLETYRTAIAEGTELTGQAFLDAVAKAEEAAGKINQLSDRSRQSLENLQEALRDSAQGLKETPEFIAATFEALTESIEEWEAARQRVTDGSEEFIESVESFSKKTVDSINELLVRIGNLPEESRAGFDQTAQELVRLKFKWVGEFNTMSDAVQKLADVNETELLDSISVLATYVDGVRESGNATREQADIIIRAYDEIIAKIRTLPEGQREVFQRLVDQMGDVEGEFSELTSKMAKANEKAAKDSEKAWNGFFSGLRGLFKIIAEEAAQTGQVVRDSLSPGDAVGETLEEVTQELIKLENERDRLQDKPLLSLEEVNRLDEINGLITELADKQRSLGPIGFGPDPKDAKEVAKIAKQTEKYRQAVSKLVLENEDFRKSFSKATDEQQDRIQTIVESFDRLIESQGGSADAAEDFGRRMSDVLREVEGVPQDLLRQFENLGGGVDSISDAFDQLRNDVRKQEESFDSFGDAAEDNVQRLEELSDKIEEFSEKATESVQTVTKELSNLNGALKTALSTCKELTECMRELGGV